MDKIKLTSHLRRRIVQGCSALLFNPVVGNYFTGNIYRGPLKGLCVPVLNCYSCPAAVGSCPLGTLQNALGGPFGKLLFYVIGALLLFGLLLGRIICGFLCPFGLIQELLFRVPVPKLKKSRVTRSLSYGWLCIIRLSANLSVLPARWREVSPSPLQTKCCARLSAFSSAGKPLCWW